MLCISLVLMQSCDPDLVVFDPDNGQTALSFGETVYNLSIPEENLTIEIPVNITTRSNSARDFNVVVDEEATTPGTSSEYSIGSVSIPAGEYSGTLAVDFTFANIGGMDGETKDLVINLVAPDGGATYNDVATITYFREIICNDLELEVVSDIFGTETGYTITDDQGNVVAGVEPGDMFPGNFCTQLTYTESITLPDGDYTFTILDSFGDGMIAQNNACGPDDIIGTYRLSCSIIVHAQGGGASVGAAESTDFSVNP